MGVGTPADIVGAVERGIDMFDCVMPTRSGRHGQAFTWTGKLNMRNAAHIEDSRPLDETSACPAARDYFRAYIHHLIRAGEYLAPMILSWAKYRFYQELMAAIRQSFAKAISKPSPPASAKPILRPRSRRKRPSQTHSAPGKVSKPRKGL